jgi:hypothetical protein
MMVDPARIGGRAFRTVNNVPFAFTPKTLSKFDSFMAPSGLLLFGPVAKPIAQSRNITCRRFRQRLCVKHKERGRGNTKFPQKAHQRFGLVRLTARTAGFPWATT